MEIPPEGLRLDARRIGHIKRNIFRGTEDANYFHKLGLQYETAGEFGKAGKAFCAERACRLNVSELERELIER